MNNLDPKKVVLGMSGGVDSSVSLILLKQAGYEVIGVSLRYDVYKCSKRKENVCCSQESFQRAKQICQTFGVEHVIIDVAKDFDSEVIEYFTDELRKMNTPSPCVFCNKKVKFKSLIDYADEIGAKYVATGHYAKVQEIDFEGNQEPALVRGADETKDQTYSLSFLEKSYLTRIIFPLADLTKEEVYEIASKTKSLSFYKKIKQSQDFCFIDGAEIDQFIAKEIKPVAGNIVDEQGNVLGRHKGLSYYTIGQRKKIELPGGPYYVVKKIKPNILVVTKDVSKTFSSLAKLKPINLLLDLSSGVYEILVKARSAEELKKATLTIKDGEASLSFSKPVLQLVSGQVAVFYLKNSQLSDRLICLGGGVIN